MRRVAITGVGIVSSIGNSADEVAASLQAGTSGVELVAERKELGFHSALAGTIKNFEPPSLPKKNLRYMAQNSQFAYVAARQAIDEAGLDDEQLRDGRTGVLVGNEGQMREVYQNGYTFSQLKKKLSAMSMPRTMASSVSANLSVALKTRGYCMTIAGACSSGAMAIGQATQLIRCGLQDRVIVGATQESSWEFDCNFDALRAFSRREDRPTEASRPFDEYRDGLVPSCGAGFLVLEEWDQALARGANVQAELIGYGINSDGYDMTTASETGGFECMTLALADAGISVDRVDLVSAHATSTPVGDSLEAESIARVFGRGPFVSATKSITGHELAAAGATECVYTLLMMRKNFVAPSINIEKLDDCCNGITVVANEAIDAQIEIAVSNSFGFGGVNATMIMRRHR